MTPTCVCEKGYVAIADFEGGVQCVEPDDDVPSKFYNKRLPELALSGGRIVNVPPPEAESGCQISRSSSLGAAFMLGLIALLLGRHGRKPGQAAP